MKGTVRVTGRMAGLSFGVKGAIRVTTGVATGFVLVECAVGITDSMTGAGFRMKGAVRVACGVAAGHFRMESAERIAR